MAGPRLQARRSLKARALQLLAQRDQSRLELRRKLVRHARADAQQGDAAGDAVEPVQLMAQVDALLDWLEANRFLSNERFVESRVHARAARFGNLRIKSELAQHALAVPPELQRALADSELARAQAVRDRRFAGAPRDVAERAAQSRFLAARGFSPEVVQRLMRRPHRADEDGAASVREPD